MDVETRFESANALAQLAAELVLGAPSERLAARLFESLAPSLGLDVFVHFVHRRGQPHLSLAGWHGIDDDQAAAIGTLPIGEAVCGYVAQTRRPHAAVDIPDTTDVRYGLLRAFGLRSYVCHPLLAEDEVLGTLSFGSRDRSSFEDDEVALLRTASDILAAGVARTQAGASSNGLRERLAEAEAKISQLQHALDSRVVIEQAKGILAQRHGVPVEVAFEQLRRHARSNRLRIHHAAQQVVDGHELPPG